jgi:hypothetical protein
MRHSPNRNTQANGKNYELRPCSAIPHVENPLLEKRWLKDKIRTTAANLAQRFAVVARRPPSPSGNYNKSKNLATSIRRQMTSF